MFGIPTWVKLWMGIEPMSSLKNFRVYGLTDHFDRFLFPLMSISSMWESNFFRTRIFAQTNKKSPPM
jgi:hypothetical protein